jgi:hypothetical protein
MNRFGHRRAEYIDDDPVRGYTAAFGADHVMVMPYELLREAPDETIADAERMLVAVKLA